MTGTLVSSGKWDSLREIRNPPIPVPSLFIPRSSIPGRAARVLPSLSQKKSMHVPLARRRCRPREEISPSTSRRARCAHSRQRKKSGRFGEQPSHRDTERPSARVRARPHDVSSPHQARHPSERGPHAVVRRPFLILILNPGQARTLKFAPSIQPALRTLRSNVVM